jgi:hypothetical protein
MELEQMLALTMNFEMVGTSRCDVPARVSERGMKDISGHALCTWFRRLTLRSATGTAQRAVPTLPFRASKCEHSFRRRKQFMTRDNYNA